MVYIDTKVNLHDKEFCSKTDKAHCIFFFSRQERPFVCSTNTAGLFKVFTMCTKLISIQAVCQIWDTTIKSGRSIYMAHVLFEQLKRTIWSICPSDSLIWYTVLYDFDYSWKQIRQCKRNFKNESNDLYYSVLRNRFTSINLVAHLDTSILLTWHIVWSWKQAYAKKICIERWKKKSRWTHFETSSSISADLRPIIKSL